MSELNLILIQERHECWYNRRHIDAKIKKAITCNPVMQEKMALGHDLLSKWLHGSYYESKMKRLHALKFVDLDDLILDILVGVAYFRRPELFSSAAAILAHRLDLSDRVEAVTTVAEILAVLCRTDAFDITKADKMASLMLVSQIPLPKELIAFMEGSEILPPMVCKPLELTHNYSSGYLTHNDSLILGSGNHHNGDICLDALNIMNSVTLKLDKQFLSTIEEMPTFELDTPEKRDNWTRFKTQSYAFYTLLARTGAPLYLTHKVDKRGRAYAMGYHINTQGSPFKKASLELHHEELVEGVPA